MRKYLVLAVLILALLVPSIAFAETGSLSFTATRYYGGQPIPGARLVLENKATGVKTAGKTDLLGNYVFTNVPYSHGYVVWFSCGGYVSSGRLVDINAPLVSTTQWFFSRSDYLR